MKSAAVNHAKYIAALPAWQAQLLKEFAKLIHEVSAEVTEEIKWGVPAFIFKSKVLFTMAAFKNHVKYNFILNGAQLDDTSKLFNNGVDSAKSRAIDISEGQQVNPADLKELVRQALTKVGA